MLKRYDLDEDSNNLSLHSQLAKYFQTQPKSSRKLEELPYHLAELGAEISVIFPF